MLKTNGNVVVVLGWGCAWKWRWRSRVIVNYLFVLVLHTWMVALFHWINISLHRPVEPNWQSHRLTSHQLLWQVSPYRPMAAVVSVLHHWRWGHLLAQVVVSVHCQPEVTVHQSKEGESLGPRAHLHLLKKKDISQSNIQLISGFWENHKIK